MELILLFFAQEAMVDCLGLLKRRVFTFPLPYRYIISYFFIKIKKDFWIRKNND